MNKVILIGRLVKDVELRKTQNGKSVVSYTLAVNRQIKQEGQPDADFINCVAWNKTADLMEQYLHKGSLIGVEGRIQVRSYQDNNGKNVYVTEVLTDSVQFLEPRSNGQAQTNVGNTNTPPRQRNAQNTQNNGIQYGPSLTAQAEAEYPLDIDSDDLPF